MLCNERMRFLHTTPLLFLGSGYVLGQATHTVTVGVRGSFYDPPVTNALEGDIVTFIFEGVIHGVTQSSFEQPCLPLQGGFSSGLLGTNGSTEVQAPTWSIIISNQSEPIWFFCESTQPLSHCASGMVGAINAPSDQFDQFRLAAEAVTGTPKPTPTLILSGIGAFATATPTTISLSPSVASSLFASPVTITDGPTASSATPSDERNGKGIPIGAVAGGVAAGVVALAVIILLLFLLYRQRRRNPRDGRNITSEKERSPSAALLRRGMTESVADSELTDSAMSRAGSTMRRQGSTRAFSANTESVDQTVQMQSTGRNIGVNHHRGFSEVAMVDAFNMPVVRHPYAQAKYRQEHSPPPTSTPDCSAANMHEIAKEVASLLRSSSVLPQTATPVHPASHARNGRQLPNPTQYLRPEPVQEEPESPALPRYER